MEYKGLSNLPVDPGFQTLFDKNVVDSKHRLLKLLGIDDKPTPTASKYHVEIKPGVVVDVYDVLVAYEITNPAIQHAIKKLLMAGKRGYKDQQQDLLEAQQSITRALELLC
jgi:hypothetical protein